MEATLLAIIFSVIILFQIYQSKKKEEFYMQEIQILVNKLMSRDFTHFTSGTVAEKIADKELADAASGVDDRKEADMVI